MNEKSRVREDALDKALRHREKYVSRLEEGVFLPYLRTIDTASFELFWDHEKGEAAVKIKD